MKRVLVLLLWLGSPAAQTADISFTVGKLRTYCKACHALGELRFINSENDGTVWRYLFENRSPRSGKLWSEAILQVLDWPTDSSPPFDQWMIPPDRDWMPKGKKRLDLAADTVNGIPSRRLIRRNLLEGYR